jgi:hypothetical protein
MRWSMGLGWVLGVHGELNCNSFYLTRAKQEFFIAITHEQRVLTSFLSWDSLVLILVNFP